MFLSMSSIILNSVTFNIDSLSIFLSMLHYISTWVILNFPRLF
jgi:hypothetical protein